MLIQTTPNVAHPALSHFGGTRAFHGEIATVKVFEDNVLARNKLNEPGESRVLVVDGGGSTRCALAGDQLATLALENGWAGVVINGCIRADGLILSEDFLLQ